MSPDIRSRENRHTLMSPTFFQLDKSDPRFIDMMQKDIFLPNIVGCPDNATINVNGEVIDVGKEYDRARVAAPPDSSHIHQLIILAVVVVFSRRKAATYKLEEFSSPYYQEF